LKLLKKNPVDDITAEGCLALETLEYKGFPRDCRATLLWSCERATEGCRRIPTKRQDRNAARSSSGLVTHHAAAKFRMEGSCRTTGVIL
jgi:hypothetical protein